MTVYIPSKSFYTIILTNKNRILLAFLISTMNKYPMDKKSDNKILVDLLGQIFHFYRCFGTMLFNEKVVFI